jgi:hypothetical protein
VRLGATVAVVALCALALAAPANAAKRPSCSRFGGTTEAQNSKVRVFYKWFQGGLPEERLYYGCLRRTGKRKYLTDAYSYQTGSAGPGPFHLHGALVAWAEDVCGSEDCDPGAFTVDLRSRKLIRSYWDSRRNVYSGILDLQLAPSGSLGLMQGNTSDLQGGGPYTYDVISVTAGGPTVLDSGADIDETSLAMGGRWLYWTRAGQPHSAQLR